MSNESGFLKHARKALAHLGAEYGVKLTPSELDAITDSVRQVIQRDRVGVEASAQRECEPGTPDENILTEKGWS